MDSMGLPGLGFASALTLMALVVGGWLLVAVACNSCIAQAVVAIGLVSETPIQNWPLPS